MVNLFWTTTDIHVSTVLDREELNANYFVQHILRPRHLLSIGTIARRQKKKFIAIISTSRIHKANVATATLSQIRVGLVPDVPYSPDLAPSDFSLSGYLKQKLLVLEFDSPQAIPGSIKVEFQKIRPRSLKRFLRPESFTCINTLNAKEIIFLRTKQL